MRGIIRGEVVEVEDASYVNKGGQKVASYNVYVMQDGGSARFGADRINCPADKLSRVGDRVEYLVNFSARLSPRTGKEYLSVFALDVVEIDAATGLRAVGE